MTGDPRSDGIPKRRLSPFKVLSSLFVSSYFALHSRIISHLFTLDDFITGFQSDQIVKPGFKLRLILRWIQF